MFDFEIMDKENIPYPAPDGAYINGLFLEGIYHSHGIGAKWDIYKHCLEESLPNTIYDKMPTVNYLVTLIDLADT